MPGQWKVHFFFTSFRFLGSLTWLRVADHDHQLFGWIVERLSLSGYHHLHFPPARRVLLAGHGSYELFCFSICHLALDDGETFRHVLTAVWPPYLTILKRCILFLFFYSPTIWIFFFILLCDPVFHFQTRSKNIVPFCCSKLWKHQCDNRVSVRLTGRIIFFFAAWQLGALFSVVPRVSCHRFTELVQDGFVP